MEKQEMLLNKDIENKGRNVLIRISEQNLYNFLYVN